MLVVANTCSRPFWWLDEGKQQTQAVQNPSPVAGGLERRLETESVPVHENMLHYNTWNHIYVHEKSFKFCCICLCEPHLGEYDQMTWYGVHLWEEHIIAKVASEVTDHVHPAHISTCVFLSHKVGQCPTDQTAGVFMMSQTRGKSGICWSLARWAGS